jgi:hypothetical protein
VNRVLKGEKPEDLPVQIPNRSNDGPENSGFIARNR